VYLCTGTITKPVGEKRPGEGTSWDRHVPETNIEQESNGHSSVSPSGHLYAN
jgi:hypothetical protein